MSDLAAYLGAAVLVALAAWAFAIERRGVRRPIRWAALAFAVCEGCSLALLAPGTVSLSRAGVDGLSVIALGDTVRTVALSFLMVLACLLNPRPGRRHSARGQAVVAVAVQGAIVLLFIAARPTLDGGGQLVAGPGGRWPLAVRVVVFAGYAVWALAEMFIALVPSARGGGGGALRWGEWLILAAIGVGVVWTLWSYDDFVQVLRHGVLDGSEDTVSNSLGAVCALLAVTGAVVGKGSVPLDAVARRVRLCRAYIALGPLWSALHEAMPQIAFPPTGRPLHAWRLAGIEFALYRRVIEIHDGRLVLRAYHQPEVGRWLAEVQAQTQTQRCGATDPALLEAATIAAALANMRSGLRSAEAAKRAETTDAGEAAAEIAETANATEAIGAATTAAPNSNARATPTETPTATPTPPATSLATATATPTETPTANPPATSLATTTPTETPTATPAPAPAPSPTANPDTDLAAEVQWLTRVAHAFRHSPAIPVLLGRLQQERSPHQNGHHTKNKAGAESPSAIPPPPSTRPDKAGAPISPPH